jgi:phosphomethylpyrimidine synthase
MCGPDFCSMKITQDLRRYAEQHGLSDDDALEAGLHEKAEQFRTHGDRAYLPVAD